MPVTSIARIACRPKFSAPSGRARRHRENLCGNQRFLHKEWKGSFYPEKLPANAMLAHYSRRLPAVEISNTFYRMPRVEQLEKWSSQVSEEFRFSLKGVPLNYPYEAFAGLS